MAFARPTVALLLATCALIGVGCGSQAAGPGTTLTITRDFGAEVLAGAQTVPLTNGLTAMRQLESKSKITTSYGGRYVDSINGVKEDSDSSWLIYVNGIEIDRGATSTRLAGGDRVQWDFHPWQLVRTGGAIVGAYPRPLKSEGVRLLCAPATGAPCKLVRKALTANGITENANSSVRMVVGSWNDINGLDGVPDLTDSTTSGGFAEFSPGGQELRLIAADGNEAQVLRRGAGLLAAYAPNAKDVTWLVTGTDTAGVKQATRLLARPELLQHRFAFATGGADPIPLPVDDDH